MEIDRARQLRHLDARARQAVLRVRRYSRFFDFGVFSSLRGLLEATRVQLLDLVDDPCSVFLVLFSVSSSVSSSWSNCTIFLIESVPLRRSSPTADQFLEHDRRARNRLEHHQVPALHALGDGHFVLALEQRHGAHFAQVQAHGIVVLVEHPRRQVQFALFGYGQLVLGFDFGGFGGGRIGGGAGGLGGGEVFVNIDAVALEGGEQVVDLFRGMHFGRQNVVYFVVEQVAALLAHGNELLYLVVFLFNRQRQGILPKKTEAYAHFGAGCAGYSLLYRQNPHGPEPDFRKSLCGGEIMPTGR